MAGTLFVVAGELYFVAGKWILSIALMNKTFKGCYQGAAACLEAMITAGDPAFMSLVVILPSNTGWIILLNLFVVAGISAPVLGK